MSRVSWDNSGPASATSKLAIKTMAQQGAKKRAIRFTLELQNADQNRKGIGVYPIWCQRCVCGKFYGFPMKLKAPLFKRLNQSPVYNPGSCKGSLGL